MQSGSFGKHMKFRFVCLEEKLMISFCCFFRKDEDQSRDSFKYTGKYWELRKDPGFIKMAFSKLW